MEHYTTEFVGLNDKELLKKTLAGNNAAYDEIVERYRARIFNVALKITRHHADAEEVLQETFSSAYLKIDRFKGKSAFSSWIYRIAVNAALMKLRKRKKHQAVPLDTTDCESNVFLRQRSDSSDLDYMSTRHELRSMLNNAIYSLPEGYQEVFVLRDIDGLKNEEVSEILGLTVATIKSRLHRARLFLREKLANYWV